MSYFNNLIKNIEMIDNLIKYEKDVYQNRDISLSDIKNLNNDKNKELLDRLDVPKKGSNFLGMRYVLSSEKLQENILKLSQEDARLYRDIIFDWRINEYVSAENLSLFKTDILNLLLTKAKEKGDMTPEELSLVLIYALKEGFLDDVDVLTKCIDVVYKYSASCFRSNEERKAMLEKVDFCIKNSLEKLSYMSIKKILEKEMSEDCISYLRYISNHGIDSIFQGDGKNILPSLRYGDDLIKRQLILEEIKSLTGDNFNVLLQIFEDYYFSNKEINTFLYKIKNNEECDIEAIVNEWDMKYLLSFIYPNFNPDYCSYIDNIELYHYALRNGKKKFLKVFDEYNSQNDLPAYCRYITKSSIYKIVNLNSLTIDDIRDINSTDFYNCDDKFKDLYKYGLRNISIKELKFVKSLTDMKFEVYKRLLDLKVDTRMSLVAELPSLKGEIAPVEYLEKIANLIREKSLNNRINAEYSKLNKVMHKKIDKKIWLEYFLIEDLGSIKNQIKNDLDVVFAVNYWDEIQEVGYTDFEEIKREIYLTSDLYNEFIKILSASKEFLEENQSRIYEFFLSGMMEVFKKYYDSLNTSAANNLIKITKAELSGKLEDIKFYKGDLSKEIGYDISDEKESIWKENIKSKGQNYMVEEAYDYETIIKLGAIPVTTCMHYNGGGYNHCLLSNFDANKKVILGKSNDGAIYGRAILRLTKISDSKVVDVTSDGLAFRDVENLSESVETESKKEELVLFLERCYTSVDDKENMHLDMLRLAYEKAKQLGVRLMVAKSYDVYSMDFEKDMQARSKSYIYISKSKNGHQYLDSFEGSVTNDSSGYIKSHGHPIFLQEGMLDETFETKLN